MTSEFVVIGSNSFSGSYFIRYLLEQNYKVIGVSRSDEINEVFLPYRWLKEEQTFNYKKIDLNHDLEALIGLIKEKKPEYIVNFAAQGMVAQSWLTPEDWYQTNVVAQVKLHNKLKDLKFLKKYVHVTTPEVYGNTEGWVKENFNFDPSTPYAVSRASCDLHLNSFYKAYNFPVVFTRAANVYGPGQQLFRIIPRTIFLALTKGSLQLHGGGYSIRSFIHMADVASATLKVALQGKIGETYHISTKSTISIRDLVSQICKMLEVNFNELVEDTEDRLGKDQSYLLESSKIREELGWKDMIELDRGLRETLSWVEDNLSILKSQPLDYQHKR